MKQVGNRWRLVRRVKGTQINFTLFRTKEEAMAVSARCVASIEGPLPGSLG